MRSTQSPDRPHAGGAERARHSRPRSSGFHDAHYRERRNAIARLALEYREGDPAPLVDYTEETHDLAERVGKPRAASWRAGPSRSGDPQRTRFLSTGAGSAARHRQRGLTSGTGIEMLPVGGFDLGARFPLRTRSRRVSRRSTCGTRAVRSTRPSRRHPQARRPRDELSRTRDRALVSALRRGGAFGRCPDARAARARLPGHTSSSASRGKRRIKASGAGRLSSRLLKNGCGRRGRPFATRNARAVGTRLPARLISNFARAGARCEQKARRPKGLRRRGVVSFHVAARFPCDAPSRRGCKPHRLRRVASDPTPRRSQRRSTPFFSSLLGVWRPASGPSGSNRIGALSGEFGGPSAWTNPSPRAPSLFGIAASLSWFGGGFSSRPARSARCWRCSFCSSWCSRRRWRFPRRRSVSTSPCIW